MLCDMIHNMSDSDIEIVKVLQWEWVEPNELHGDRNPQKPVRGWPLIVEAQCHQCDLTWTSKKSWRGPGEPKWFAVTTGFIHLTCPSCGVVSAVPVQDIE